MNEKKKKILGICCERSVDLKKHLENNKLKDDPNVSIVQLTCSGEIQPLMIEHAFKSGADGVFVLGCQIGDCHFREGNKWCQARLLGERPPNIKKTVDLNKVRGFWLSKVDYGTFIEKVKKFEKELDEYLSTQTKEEAKS